MSLYRQAKGHPFVAAECLLSLFRGESDEKGWAGGMLLAEALQAIREKGV